MSDPKSSYGEPVEEPNGVDDVVGRANEGLADAAAARRDAVDADSPTAAASAPSDAHDASAPAVADEPAAVPADEAVAPATTTPACRADGSGGR